MEFNIEFLLFSSLGSSIYRLTDQMSIWLDKKLGSVRTVVMGRLDGQLCDQLSENFAEILSCF
jgi:hypothetical protein